MMLVTPTEDAEHFALARYHGMSLAALIRQLLRKERRRLERAGVRVPKK